MTLTKSGIWYPDGNFTANPRVIAAQQAANLEAVITNERLRSGSVDYASTAARDAANPTPVQGDSCTVAGLPQTYVAGTGWVYVKTTKSPLTTHFEIKPAGTASNTNHVTIVPTIPIDAVDYPRYLAVSAIVNCSTFTIASSVPQLIFFYDSVNVVVARILNSNHCCTFTWSTLIPANTSHSMYLNMNIAANPASGVATVSTDFRFAKFIYDLLPA